MIAYSRPRRPIWVENAKYSTCWVTELNASRKLCRGCARPLIRYFRRFLRYGGLDVAPKRDFRYSGLFIACNEWAYEHRVQDLYCWRCYRPCYKLKFHGDEDDFRH